MMKRWVMWGLGLIVVLIGAWTIGSMATVSGIEEAKYSVVAKSNGYEIRRYDPSIVAVAAMPSMGREDTGAAFRAIAGFIFGGNEKQQSIAMTAPVIMDTKGASEKIAMTAPVLMEGGTMKFVMPGKYKSIADLPKPNDPRVKLIEQPARTVAALRFSWYASQDRFTQKAAELSGLLARDGIKATSQPYLASYDPPFSMPLLKRHDVLIDIEAK